MLSATPLSRPRSVARPCGFAARLSLRVALVVAAAVLVLAPRAARAEQFLLFDAMFTYTWEMATAANPKAHYFVTEKNFLNKARPTNWITPVNYRDGKVHIRAEVIAKPPGTQQAGWALCYIANVGNYGCPYTDYYTKVGVYERDGDMHTFYNNNTIQWDHGVKEVDLVYTINGSGSGHITNFPALKDLTTPTTVRITMVQVSAGATYDPSILPGVPGGGDAAPDGGVAADAARDSAGNAVDTSEPPVGGGTGGSGGATEPPPPPVGSGGSSGSGGAVGPVGAGVSASGGCVVASAWNTSNAGGALLSLGALLAFRRRRHRR